MPKWAFESSVAVCNVLQGFRRDRVPQLKDSGETESLNLRRDRVPQLQDSGETESLNFRIQERSFL